jgi:hypothetical protein
LSSFMECARDVFTMSLRDDDRPNQCASANRRYPIEIVSHKCYNLISFGGCALLDPPQYCFGRRAAAVAELGR